VIPQSDAGPHRRSDVRHGAGQLPSPPLDYPEVAVGDPCAQHVARRLVLLQRGRVALCGGRHVACRVGGEAGIGEREAQGIGIAQGLPAV
jgi:hypothetical protein